MLVYVSNIIFRYKFLILNLMFICWNALISVDAQNTTRLDFDADYVMFSKTIGDGAERWIGNVIFKHAGSVMYCDSVYYYADTNLADAYGNVHIIKDDTLHLWGDYLHYNGNTKFAEVRRNVKLIDRETVLTTTAIDYDLEKSVGYYVNHAHILNGENKLTSKEGYYYADEQFYYFKDSVVITNPDYKIVSDTLKYNTVTNISYMYGPTHIYSDSSYIYCEDGWFNTETNISELRKNAYVQNGSQEIFADSIYYEKDNEYGIARSNVEVRDSEQDVILKGNYGITNQLNETALLTDSALLIMITEEKDSIYIHADTLRVDPDTNDFKTVRAYYKVKMFKENMQGKCDSLSYASSDSIIRMYTQPVLWSEKNQLSAEYIEIRTKNNQIHELYMDQTAFIISQADSIKFNQVYGRIMTGYFIDNELYKIDVEGNGQTIYYPTDKNEFIGVNIAKSSNLVIYITNREVEKIHFINQPAATLYPLEQAPQDELILKGFRWEKHQRPLNKEAIFEWVE